MTAALAGRVALVTGASRGIGRAVALALAGVGARVAAVASQAANAAATVDAARSAGGDATAFGCDMADGEAVKALAASVAQALGPVDILINNAGITRDGLLMRMSDEDWNAVIDTNLTGAFRLVRACARNLLKSRCGRIVNVASVIGLAGNAGQANYAASKGGLIAFTKAVAKEFGGRGVTANCVAPGFIDTDMTAALDAPQRAAMTSAITLARAGTPADVAGAVLFLCTDQAAYITGQVLVVDGGMRL